MLLNDFVRYTFTSRELDGVGSQLTELNALVRRHTAVHNRAQSHT